MIAIGATMSTLPSIVRPRRTQEQWPAMGYGCFVHAGESLKEAIARVQLAESLGFASVRCTHIQGHDALTMIAVYAQATERIRLGTAVVPIYSRTPASMAQTAATIADLSGGRFELGVGVSHRSVVEGWYGQSIDRPVAEMKEYVRIVRAIIERQRPVAGDKWSTSFRLAGVRPSPELPIYGGALSPGMLRAVGEVCDGVVLWLCVPQYIEAVVLPELATGRARIGKTMEGFDVVAAVPAALVADRTEAYAALRRELLTYFSLPFYRAMLERSGFGADLAALDDAAGDIDAMQAAISDEFLDAVSAVGDVASVRTGVARYLAPGVTSPSVISIPGTDFDATLRAAASSTAASSPS